MRSKIVVLPIGGIDETLLQVLGEELEKKVPNSEIVVAKEAICVPEEAYDSSRRQYYSTKILEKISEKVSTMSAGKVLGVTAADLYVPRLNFVFGEAYCPGKVAVISINRLRPEFYNEPPDIRLLLGRMSKEAVHELGHTFGLNHCSSSECVMYFSNSIVDTDAKGSAFCDRCLQNLRLHP